MQNQHDSRATHPPVFKGFTFKAEVDWMEFCVTLKSPSQFRHVQNRMLEVWGKTHFTPTEGFASSKSFTFRLNNPISPDQFMLELQSMALPGEPPITEKDVIVSGIEIALDAYIQGSDRQALALAVAHFIRHQAHPPAGLPRITAKDKTPYEPDSIKVILQNLLEGGITINSGAMGADHTCRFYIKDYDTIDGVPYARLSPDQWRARFENTLTGNAVPFKTIQAWRDFKFESMSKDLFAMVMPSPTRSPLMTMMQARMLQLGRRPDSIKRRPSDRRQRAASTRRDSFTNDRIRQAFRALTSSQSRRNSVKPPPKLICSPLERITEPSLRPKYIHTYVTQ